MCVHVCMKSLEFGMTFIKIILCKSFNVTFIFLIIYLYKVHVVEPENTRVQMMGSSALLVFRRRMRMATLLLKGQPDAVSNVGKSPSWHAVSLLATDQVVP